MKQFLNYACDYVKGLKGPDGQSILKSKRKTERPATGENKPCPILHPLCMELLEEKIDMPLLIYDTLDVCEESFLYL